jgi:hypothetical protein
MRACNGFGKGLVILILCAAVAACGSEDDMGDGSVTGGTDGGGTGGTGGTGGGSGDAAGGSGGTAYKFLAIVDNTAVYTEALCMAGTGPGPDIDAVELKRAGATLGVGMTGTASFVDGFPGTTSVGCSNCGMMMNAACTHSGTGLAPKIEGARNANPDDGYISLNAGFVWIQIGTATGAGPAQDIKAGDTVTVHEVDQLYEMQGVACVCAPEKYSVYAYVEKGQATTRVKLNATTYRTANNAMCGALDSALGCGTSDFVVP